MAARDWAAKIKATYRPAAGVSARRARLNVELSDA